METTFAEYLTHASVFVRNFDGVIVYWPQGAMELYGFTAEEAVGGVSHHLLQTDFPVELALIESRLRVDKQWRGAARPHDARWPKNMDRKYVAS